MNPVITNAGIAGRLLLSSVHDLLGDPQPNDMNINHDGIKYALDLDWNDKGGYMEVILFEDRPPTERKKKAELLGIAAFWHREGDDADTLRYCRFLDDDDRLHPKSVATRLEIERLLNITPGEPGEILVKAA